MPARRKLTMRQLRQLLRLARDGASALDIAVTLGVARSTIQDNLKRAAAAGLSWPLPGELTDDALEGKLFGRAGVKQGVRRRPEPNWADLVIELKKPGVTLQILWEEYRAIQPGGYGYSRFCELYRGFEQRLSPTMRQEHVVGDKVFVEYSGKKVGIVDPRSGEIREAEIFVAVLRASSFTYAEASWTQTLYASSAASPTAWAREASTTSRGASVCSAAQSRNDDLKPWTVTPLSRIPRSSCNIAMLLSFRPESLWNGYRSLRGRLLSNAFTSLVSGTRCSRPAFIRSAGTVQILWSRSNSFQVAPITSLVRDAVRIVNISALALMLPFLRSWATSFGKSMYGTALWCSTFWTEEVAGSRCCNGPVQAAGFSPSRYFMALAQPRIFSIRPLSRLAVSGFVVQIGLRTLSTSSTVISFTRFLPMIGPQ